MKTLNGNIITRGKYKGYKDIRFKRCATSWRHTSKCSTCCNCQHMPFYLSCLAGSVINRRNVEWFHNFSKISIRDEEENDFITKYNNTFQSNEYNYVFSRKKYSSTWNEELDELLEELSEIHPDILEMGTRERNIGIIKSDENDENDENSLNDIVQDSLKPQDLKHVEPSKILHSISLPAPSKNSVLGRTLTNDLSGRNPARLSKKFRLSKRNESGFNLFSREKKSWLLQFQK